MNTVNKCKNIKTNNTMCNKKNTFSLNFSSSVKSSAIYDHVNVLTFCNFSLNHVAV